MTEILYLRDCYLREFEATVVSVTEERFIILDKTAFYPQSGGQPCDIGRIVRKSDGKEFKIMFVKKIGNDIFHEVSPEGIQVGDEVKGVINWERRNMLMRMHTAAHLIAAILNKDYGALITGNQLDIGISRMDFSLENFDRDILTKTCEKANNIISQNLPVKIYFLPREEALKIEGVVKLAAAMQPGASGLQHFPDTPELRIVEIEGLDKQLDGGTHVKSLGEIGKLEFVKFENKGKANRRVYFRVC